MVAIWHCYHISLATPTQRCYFEEQQCYIQSCTQVNQIEIPTSERSSLLFAVHLALSGLAYTPLTQVYFPFGNLHTLSLQLQ